MYRSSRRVRKLHVHSARLAALILPALCIFALVSPRAFAKTYVITDGDRVVTYTTFATDPYQVLDEVGLTLSGSDTCAATSSADGTAITIRRSMDVAVSYRGEWIHIPSPGDTVGELLARLGLDVTDDDTLSHPLTEPVSDGMEIRVDTIITRQETYTTAIPHETSICDDASLPTGESEVLIPGRDGELLCTAEVTYTNGVETGRKVLTRKQTVAPITEIIGQGTGNPEFEPETEEMPVIGDGFIIMPSGELLTYYKTDYVTATGYTHTDAGCDMITATGTTVHYGTVAVDPRFIPYGTRMLIVSHDGERYYGVATAEDCGGAIKRDKMDLYFPTYEECIEFGRRRCTIYFLG